MSHPWIARAILIGLAVGSVVLLWLVVRPFAKSLFLAAVLAGALHPWCTRLTRRFRGRRSLAAGVLTVAVVLLLVLPLGAVGVAIGNEIVNGVRYVQETLRSEGVAGLVEDLPPSLRNAARLVLDQIHAIENLEQLGAAQGGKAVAVARGVLTATTAALVQVALFVIALYFLLEDGKALVDWVADVAPLDREQTRGLLTEFRSVSVAVIVSSVATAAIQSTVALAGYLIAGVPQPFFFMFVTFVFAFVPAIGAAGASLATAGIVLLTGRPGAALFLALWGVVAVGLSDNVLKPWLMKGRMEIHGAVIFFALLGGVAAFGPVGLVAGPLIVAFFLAVVRMSRREFGREERATAASDQAGASPG